MANQTSLPEEAVVPEKKPVLPFDGAANATKLHEAWGLLKKADDQANVSIPGTRRSVKLSKVAATDNKLSIWVGDDTEKKADFVIVNPPTEYTTADGTYTDDPLTAIALILDGATK